MLRSFLPNVTKRILVFLLGGNHCGLVGNLTELPVLFCLEMLLNLLHQVLKIYWVGFLFGGFKLHLLTGYHSSSGIHSGKQPNEPHVRN